MWRDITYLVSDIFAQYSNPLNSSPELHFPFFAKNISPLFPTAFRSCTLLSLVLFLRVPSLNCIRRLLFLQHSCFQSKSKISISTIGVQKSQEAQQRETSGSKSYMILGSDFVLSLGLALGSNFDLSLSLNLGSDFVLSLGLDLVIRP